MQRKAKIFMNSRSQAVRLPKKSQFKTRKVYIRKVGSDVVLSRSIAATAGLVVVPGRGPCCLRELHGRR
jgi:virulence-associated protein VagC